VTERRRALAGLALAPEEARADLAGCGDAWARWGDAVALMACGSYRSAFATLTPLTDHADTELAGMAAAALASGLRQLDEHPAAVSWDERACGSAGQALVDGRIGLAADAVGLGHPDEAARHLDRAVALAGGWRDRTRVSWVRTEVALMRQDWMQAQAQATQALEEATAVPSPRHVVKSQMFLAVVRRHLRPEAGIALLHETVAAGRAMRLRPLIWPAVVVLGTDATPAERRGGAEAAGHIAAHLPEGHGLGWSRRPDVLRLRAWSSDR
jgi:hypothetical protein